MIDPARLLGNRESVRQIQSLSEAWDQRQEFNDTDDWKWNIILDRNGMRKALGCTCGTS